MDTGQDDIAQCSIPVGALSALPGIMREFGHDPWQLLESHRIDRASFVDPMRPLPMALHGRILEDAASATDCDHLGLLLGQRATLDNAGPLRFLVLNAVTVRGSLEALVRFSPIWYRGIRAVLSHERGFAGLSLTIDHLFPGRDQILTALLVANVTILEMILGQSWRPSAVHISSRESTSTDLFRRFFRSTVLFDQPKHQVLFPAGLLDQVRGSSDPKLEIFLRRHLSELQGPEHPGLVARVRHAIEGTLQSGDCTIDHVAELFSVHRFTLHRHLARHGTSFEDLLDDTRRKTAEQMLTSTDLALADIATLVGYRNQGSFTRAFRRWHGQTPTSWRRTTSQPPTI